MKSKRAPHAGNTVDMRPLKGKLRKKLPPESSVLIDQLAEPDLVRVENAEVLIRTT
ncbi:MAG: hypothetical protein OK456_06410 [Thaumarchaeota archaeon]|nr:hypothetical protein [Nitrososphaerota archaeon]